MLVIVEPPTMGNGIAMRASWLLRNAQAFTNEVHFRNLLKKSTRSTSHIIRHWRLALRPCLVFCSWFWRRCASPLSLPCLAAMSAAWWRRWWRCRVPSAATAAASPTPWPSRSRLWSSRWPPLQRRSSTGDGETPLVLCVLPVQMTACERWVDKLVIRSESISLVMCFVKTQMAHIPVYGTQCKIISHPAVATFCRLEKQ